MKLDLGVPIECYPLKSTAVAFVVEPARGYGFESLVMSQFYWWLNQKFGRDFSRALRDPIHRYFRETYASRLR
jgi:hypothetical protein